MVAAGDRVGGFLHHHVLQFFFSGAGTDPNELISKLLPFTQKS